jgi:hypothetical protein
MGCLKSSNIGQQAPTQGTTEPYRDFQVELMKKITEGVTGAWNTAGPVPGNEFAPAGANALQNQAFGMGSNLQNSYQNNPAFSNFDPNAISTAMKPVGDYAQSMFQQQTIPSIMASLGSTGAARGSGAIDILGKQGNLLSQNLAAQFAPMQYQGLQDQLNRQAQLPSIQANMATTMGQLGAEQRGIGESQKDYALQQWQASQPGTNPMLNYISAALGQPMGTYSQGGYQGYRDPSFMQQFFGMA